MSHRVLEVEGLRVGLRAGEREFFPVDGVSWHLDRGECLGIVGESGAGKSLALRGVIDLLPRSARLVGGEVRVSMMDDAPPQRVAPHELRGKAVGMVFQEPMRALNPILRIGDAIAEGAQVRRGLSRRNALNEAIDLLGEVGMPNAKERASAWPHELSGGQRQRVMIAMALATEPRVLLCDEPTTALDVTVQDQILNLLDRIRRERGLGVVFVTHDLAVVGKVASRVAVMYAGRIVETGPTHEVFEAPRHPYTLGLLRAAPALAVGESRLATIAGRPPDPRSFPQGCRFHPRCPYAQDDCPSAPYLLEPIPPARGSACIHHDLLIGEAGVVPL